VRGAEVVERADGNGDRYCGSVHPFSRTPCRHVVVDSRRYLVFPELNDCCFCCDSGHGCGVLRPDWLDAADYQVIRCMGHTWLLCVTLGRFHFMSTIVTKWWAQDGDLLANRANLCIRHAINTPRVAT
jgi:hypothetical protein